MLFTFLTFAQEKTITGTVSDNLGALPGVNVVEKGSKNAVSTDFNGNYSIKTKVGAVLIYNFVGMISEQKTVGSLNMINVVLKPVSNLLEEVVVVGALSIKKNKAGNYYKISKSSVLTQASNPNIIQSLQGNVSILLSL